MKLTAEEKQVMAYDEQETKHSRVVVETPNARREVSRTEREYTPERGGGAASRVLDDSSIQAEIDKRIHDNPTLSALGITATVQNGKVMLVGMVKSDQLKNQVEKLVRSVKGVKRVDNQIIVGAG